MKLSLGVKCLAVLLIIYGLYSLWSACADVLPSLGKYAEYGIWGWGSIIWGLASAVVFPALAIAGFGLITGSAWGRTLSIRLGFAMIVLAVMSLILWMRDLRLALFLTPGQFVIFCLTFIWPAGLGIFLVRFLNRPKVKAQFHPTDYERR